MKITYTNTIDDAVEWQMHLIKNSPFFRKKIFWSSLITSIILLMGFLIIGYIMQNIGLIIIGAITAPFYYLFISSWIKRDTKKNARRIYEEGESKGFLCEHELEISEEELIDRTPFGAQSLKWESIERICTVDDYTFVYVGAVSAHVLPRKRVTKGNYYDFVNELRAKSACS